MAYQSKKPLETSEVFAFASVTLTALERLLLLLSNKGIITEIERDDILADPQLMRDRVIAKLTANTDKP